MPDEQLTDDRALSILREPSANDRSRDPLADYGELMFDHGKIDSNVIALVYIRRAVYAEQRAEAAERERDEAVEACVRVIEETWAKNLTISVGAAEELIRKIRETCK